MHRFRILGVGDPAPIFTAQSNVNPQFKFDTVAGRYVVLAFLGVLDADANAALEAVRKQRSLFDDDKIAFFGVMFRAPDGPSPLAREFRFFFDHDGSIGAMYGVVPVERGDSTSLPYVRKWIVLDPLLRVMAVFPFQADGSDRSELINFISALPPLDLHGGSEAPPPVLILPRILEPALCRRLIDLYDNNGGKESGFMREVEGKTVATLDHQHKRRSDYIITDPELIQLLQRLFQRRVVPEIARAYQYKATRMERYIVGCYDSSTGGHFRAHRDNTTKGTAHRRFAVSINLNGDFEGGTVHFPEFSRRGYKPPPGGCVVFSCSLMHAVSPVTAGKRYAFLPFLYDEEAAKVRETNNEYLGEGVGSYRAQ